MKSSESLSGAERKPAGALARENENPTWQQQQSGATAAPSALTGINQNPASQNQHASHIAKAAQIMAAATVSVPQGANLASAASARTVGVNLEEVNSLSASGRQDLMTFLAPRPNASHSPLSSRNEPPNISSSAPPPIGPALTKQPQNVLAGSKTQQMSQGTSSEANCLGSSKLGKKLAESPILEIPPAGAPLPSMTDMLLFDIPTTFIHPHDVLCGRGGGTNNHSGNEQFRALVNSKKVEYLHSIKREKPRVSRGIVRAVRNQNPPGRFLQKDEKTGLWYDIGDQKAQEKTSQALRERAPELRREITDALGGGPGRGGLVPVHALSYRGVPNIPTARASIGARATQSSLENGSLPTGNTSTPGFRLHMAQAAAAAQRVPSQQQTSAGGIDQYERLRLQAAARAQANHAAFAMQNHQKMMRQQAAAAAAAIAAAHPGNKLRNAAQSHQNPPFRDNMARSHEKGNEIPVSHPRNLWFGQSEKFSNEQVNLNSLRGGSASSQPTSATSIVVNSHAYEIETASTKSRIERKSGSSSLGSRKIRDHHVEDSLPIDCVRRLDLAESLARKTANGTITDQQKDEEYRISLYMDAGLLGIEPCDLIKGLSQGKTESDVVEESYEKYGKKRRINGFLPPLKRCHKIPGALEGLGALTKLGIDNALSIIGSAT